MRIYRPDRRSAIVSAVGVSDARSRTVPTRVDLHAFRFDLRRHHRAARHCSRSALAPSVSRFCTAARCLFLRERKRSDRVLFIIIGGRKSVTIVRVTYKRPSTVKRTVFTLLSCTTTYTVHGSLLVLVICVYIYSVDSDGCIERIINTYIFILYGCIQEKTKSRGLFRDTGVYKSAKRTFSILQLSLL